MEFSNEPVGIIAPPNTLNPKPQPPARKSLQKNHGNLSQVFLPLATGFPWDPHGLPSPPAEMEIVLDTPAGGRGFVVERFAGPAF